MMWIPRPLYEVLPYAYMAAGAAALGAAFFAEHAPHGFLMLLGGLGLTVGLVLWMRRRDYRASQAEYDGDSLDE
jgi:hypothetical protein